MSVFRVVGARVTLEPPKETDLDWILGALGRPEVARTLGWADGIGAEIYSGYIEGTVMLLPFRNADGERVGFLMLMRDDTSVRSWTVNIVIPDPKRRNGFTAIAACDALCHLIFDVRGDDGLVWLIEPSNGASRVLPKRLGYQKIGDVDRDGTTYERYGIGADAWHARRAKRGLRYEAVDVPLTQVAHGRIIAAVRPPASTAR